MPYTTTFDHVLEPLRKGCHIYRESRPDLVYAFRDGQITNVRMDGNFGHGGDCALVGKEILADDWLWRCPGHRWRYHQDGDLRQCEICEHEEPGDWREETLAYWAAKGLPAPTFVDFRKAYDTSEMFLAYWTVQDGEIHYGIDVEFHKSTGGRWAYSYSNYESWVTGFETREKAVEHAATMCYKLAEERAADVNEDRL